MKASECKCIECGKPAVAFWPVIDPDITPHPYCRECLNKAKLRVLIETFGFAEEDVQNFSKGMEDIGR